MAGNTVNNFPMGELLRLLKAKGFDVSMDQIFSIQAILVSSSVVTSNTAQLKYLIAPLIAKNEEEQKTVYQIVDEYVAAKTAPEEKLPGFWKRFFTGKKMRIIWKLSIVLLVLTIAVIFYFNQPQASKPVAIQPSSDTTVLPVNKPDTVGKTLPKSGSEPGEPQQQPFSYQLSATGPITPVAMNSNLQISGLIGILLGIILSFFIFYQDKKALTSEKRDPSQREPLSTADPGTEDLFDFTQQEQKNVLSPVSLQFPDKNFLIQRSREFFKIRNNLKKLDVIDHDHPNMRKSIGATVRNAGFRTLVHDRDAREKRFLVLLDAREQNGHLYALFQYFVHYLQSSAVALRLYKYSTDIRYVKDASGREYELQQLADRKSDWHLIIIGNSRKIGNADAGFSVQLQKLFRQWTSRSFITTLPLADWNTHEHQLYQNGFRVSSADIEAVEALSKAISDDTVLRKEKLAATLHDRGSLLDYDLNSVNGLRQYCNDDFIFQCACALAVYPKLEWPVTLSVYAALLDHHRPKEEQVTYNRLLKLSRIPWLQQSQLSPSLRLQLLNALLPQYELPARETILKLLEERQSQLPEDSPAFRELSVQHTVNAFFLYAHDEHRYRKYRSSKDRIKEDWESLDEWALKERTDKNQSGLMPLNSSGQHMGVEEFILRDRQLEAGNVTVSKVAVLILPALLLYIIFSILKPAAVYPIDTYKPVSFQLVLEKGQGCEQDSIYAVVNGVPQTGELVRDMKYNRDVMISVWTKNQRLGEIDGVKATDSVVTIRVNCR